MLDAFCRRHVIAYRRDGPPSRDRRLFTRLLCPATSTFLSNVFSGTREPPNLRSPESQANTVIRKTRTTRPHKRGRVFGDSVGTRAHGPPSYVPPPPIGTSRPLTLLISRTFGPWDHVSPPAPAKQLRLPQISAAYRRSPPGGCLQRLPAPARRNYGGPSLLRGFGVFFSAPERGREGVVLGAKTGRRGERAHAGCQGVTGVQDLASSSVLPGIGVKILLAPRASWAMQGTPVVQHGTNVGSWYSADPGEEEAHELFTFQVLAGR
ncbi:hypothetical protein C8Q79DRAFT_926913 [Trametes meyenii]|nr:hypothetical protein C8Q79DRAFT_926913 [Trametes meyenii]